MILLSNDYLFLFTSSPSLSPHPFYIQDQGFGLLMGKLQAALDADAFTNDAVVKYDYLFSSLIISWPLFLLFVGLVSL